MEDYRAGIRMSGGWGDVVHDVRNSGWTAFRRRVIERLMKEMQITPKEVKERLDRGEKLLLVDVREPQEYAICRIEGATLVPMGAIPANLQKLDVDEDVICYCHHGMRSLDVANWLRSKGVNGAKSMTGGIDRWSIDIDPSVPRY
jgi:adenylyltransferase/sulfurtransferase